MLLAKWHSGILMMPLKDNVVIGIKPVNAENKQTWKIAASLQKSVQTDASITRLAANLRIKCRAQAPLDHKTR